jgi:Zn-dependent peptidase ImmA (M78 family)
MLDKSSRDALTDFWRACGEENATFPRDLERCVALSLPVAVVKLSRLGVAAIREWLLARGGAVWSPLNGADRAIRGCLLAFGGRGVILLDGTDPQDEQRFTLAHEVSHFVLDYWLPRCRALAKLGPGILEVLDGLRAATPDERLSALLTGVSLRPYVDLLDRESDISVAGRELDEIELRADAGAFQLIAPASEVRRRAGVLALRYADRQAEMVALLRQTFGLPAYAAVAYAVRLLAAAGKGRSFAESLRD